MAVIDKIIAEDDAAFARKPAEKEKVKFEARCVAGTHPTARCICRCIKRKLNLDLRYEMVERVAEFGFLVREMRTDDGF